MSWDLWCELGIKNLRTGADRKYVRYLSLWLALPYVDVSNIVILQEDDLPYHCCS